LIETLTSGKNVIKAFCEIAPLDTATGSAAGNGLAYAGLAERDSLLVAGEQATWWPSC